MSNFTLMPIDNTKEENADKSSAKLSRSRNSDCKDALNYETASDRAGNQATRMSSPGGVYNVDQRNSGNCPMQGPGFGMAATNPLLSCN